jgi:hypothetical protein
VATQPAEEEPQPTRAQRVRAVVVRPDYRLPAFLAAAAASVALAPVPFGSLGAACLVVAAAEAARRR